MAPSVLLIGAGGAFGNPLLDEFMKQKHNFSKIGILSDPAKVGKFDKFRDVGVEVVKGSYLDAKAYTGYDTVISIVGNYLLKLQPAIIDTAIAGGIHHFYPSEFGSDVAQYELRDFRYFRDKRVTRDHLVAKAKEVPGFRYTLMVTGVFTEWAAAEFYGVDVEAKVVRAYGKAEAAISVTSIPDIAKYTVDSVLLPFSSPQQQKRVIKVTGDQTTWGKLIADLGKAQGVVYEQSYLPVAEALQKQEEARVAEDEALEMMWSVKPLAASGNAIVPGKLDNGMFSFRPETALETYRRVYGTR